VAVQQHEHTHSLIMKHLIDKEGGSPVNQGFFAHLKALRILCDEGIKINLEVCGIYGKEAE